MTCSTINPRGEELSRIQRALLAGAVALLLSVPGLAQAQRLVGTVTKIDGTTVSLKAADGQEASFTLADATIITVDEPATLADMKKGEFTPARQPRWMAARSCRRSISTSCRRS